MTEQFEIKEIARTVAREELKVFMPQFEKTVYEILGKELGSVHKDDHMWIKVKRDDGSSVRGSILKGIGTIIINALVMGLVLAAAFLFGAPGT